MTANHRYMSLSSLSRRPVLIAMMVYSVAYGAAAFAVWREATAISSYRECTKHYLVQSSAHRVGGTETQGSRMNGATRHFLI
jgi:hypothetical protein